MFCEGLSLDAKGRVVATGERNVSAYLDLKLTMSGGNDADKTSIYDPETNAWTAEGLMKIPRGYQSTVSLSNGNIFTIGGSWSGGEGGKNGTRSRKM